MSVFKWKDIYRESRHVHQSCVQNRIGICCVALLWIVVEITSCSAPPARRPPRVGQRPSFAAAHENVTVLSAIGGSSEAPAWSPDGASIAFGHTASRIGDSDSSAPRDVYMVHVDSLEERRLTYIEDGRSCKDPSWAPDSSKIVSVCNIDGDYDLYVLNVESGALARLAHYPGDESSPAWSPDGQYIAFAAEMDQERGESIYRVTSDGQDLIRLTTGAWATDPTWSPDSQRIAFSQAQNLPSSLLATASLCTMRSDGSEPACFDNIRCLAAEWSPSGSRIACIAGVRIISVDVTDGQSTDLVNASPYLLSGLTWSPDGTTVAFTAG